MCATKTQKGEGFSGGGYLIPNGPKPCLGPKGTQPPVENKEKTFIPWVGVDSG